MRWSVAALLGALAHSPPAVAAVQPSDFALAETRDLMTLCAAAPGDPLYLESLQFCYGCLAGISSFHRALVQGGKLDRRIPAFDQQPSHTEP